MYLTLEAYEELTNESTSHRILVKEQREKNETIECKLARKGQDLLELTSNFDTLRKDSETTKGVLDSTKSLLEETTALLANTRRMLNEETFVRQQHECTEQQLTNLNQQLVTTLGDSITDNTGLYSKLRRRSELHAQSREQYRGTQRDVVETTTLVEGRLAEFQTEQQGLVDTLSGRVHAFVKHELDELNAAITDLENKSIAFERWHKEVAAQTTLNKSELNLVLDSVTTLMKGLKKKVGAGLNDLSVAARCISEGIMTGVETFDMQLQSSYSNLVMDCKTTFDGMSKEVSEQREEMQRLRDEMAEANQQLEQSQSRSVDTLSNLVDEERTVRYRENKDLMQRIQDLLAANVQQQELRIGAIAQISAQLRSAGQSHSAAGASFADCSEQLAERSRNFSNRLTNSQDTMQTRIQSGSAVSSAPFMNR